ncbi:hypothetical protein [Tautonia marina]|uniref:hypothetical protein n=1 Tax=Tautonia marina TaxID=2653855 RepID=UPI001260C626|nr:hypothetical protein [Tautonia marina]
MASPVFGPCALVRGEGEALLDSRPVASRNTPASGRWSRLGDVVSGENPAESFEEIETFVYDGRHRFRRFRPGSTLHAPPRDDLMKNV